MEKAIKNSITDIDGNTYNGIQIDNQFWLTENLTVSKYRNGDEIPEVKDKKEWKKLTTGAWCYYENNAENGAIYGKLYNWYAVTDPRGLAPEGYHIPSNTELTELTDNLGRENVAGIKMKNSNGWYESGNGNNSSGFSALPGGFRYINGSFSDIAKVGNWWSSSEGDTSNAVSRFLNYYNADLFNYNSDKQNGFSVRCLKD